MSRGVHKICGCQVAIGSLPAEERFKTDNIMPVALALASTYKNHGMARVLCGVDAHSVAHDEPCYAWRMSAATRALCSLDSVGVPGKPASS